jgi:hypothetical protein
MRRPERNTGSLSSLNESVIYFAVVELITVGIYEYIAAFRRFLERIQYSYGGHVQWYRTLPLGFVALHYAQNYILFVFVVVLPFEVADLSDAYAREIQKLKQSFIWFFRGVEYRSQVSITIIARQSFFAFWCWYAG